MQVAPHQHSTHPLGFLAIALIAGILSGEHLRLPLAYSLRLTLVLTATVLTNLLCRGGTGWPPFGLKVTVWKEKVTRRKYKLQSTEDKAQRGRPRRAGPTTLLVYLLMFLAGTSLISVRES